ncbi:AAA family ATPase [Microvirga massiliensis]|uniref:AAA family ATPase n=1 Tax=Microvirga massiliensis TaxID=1033741 RepID=UPI00062BC92D|nr:AAA family ATPase [Microvirga massiliensis]
MAAYIVIANPQDERTRQLTGVLTQNGVRTTPIEQLDDVLKLLPENEHSLVIVPDFVGDATNLVSFSQKARGRAFVVYISDTISVDAYKQLSKSGAGEWIRWNNLGDELTEVIRHHFSGTALANGSIVTFLPSAGGVGNTTLALETAIYLATRGKAKRRVCVLDLNFQSSDFPTYLDIEPRFDISEILGNPSRLDQQLVDVLTAKHPSGVDIFASPPGRFDYGRLDSTVLFALLDEISKRYDFVHLDLPTMWFPWIDNLIIGSDRVFVTGTYNIPSVKRLTTTMQYLEGLNISANRVAALINQTETGLFGSGVVRRSDITSALPRVQVMFIRRDDKTALDAINAGRSISESGGGRGLKKDIRQVGEWIDRTKHEAATAIRSAALNRG